MNSTCAFVPFARVRVAPTRVATSFGPSCVTLEAGLVPSRSCVLPSGRSSGSSSCFCASSVFPLCFPYQLTHLPSLFRPSLFPFFKVAASRWDFHLTARILTSLPDLSAASAPLRVYLCLHLLHPVLFFLLILLHLHLSSSFFHSSLPFEAYKLQIILFLFRGLFESEVFLLHFVRRRSVLVSFPKSEH